MSDKARIASIGAGMIGEVHARFLSTEKLCEYVAVCDPDRSKKSLADKYGVPFYTDCREMIAREKLDGVVISVPNDKHLSVGVFCAAHGLHMLMEKPIAPTVPEAEQIIDAAEKNNVQLAVGHHRRFNPLMVAMKNILRRGELGKLVGISMLWGMYKPSEYFVQRGEWRTKHGGGPILINLIHEIDNLRFLHGEIESVYAETSNAVRGFEVEDSVAVTFRLKDNVLANVLMSDTSPSIWSYEASMSEFDHFEPGGGNIYHFFGDKASLAFPEMLKVSYAQDGHWGWRDPFTREQLDLRSANPYPEQMRSFCSVVLGRETPRTTGRDALQTLKVAMAVGESARTHRPVDFNV